MTAREQKKLLDELKRYESAMVPSDRDAYKMMVKRQKDDEDFDTLTEQKLTALHGKYVKFKSKSDFDQFFKK